MFGSSDRPLQLLDWKAEGLDEYPGATVVYDAASPASPRDPLHRYDNFLQQREEIRRAAFEPGNHARRGEYVRFWDEFRAGRGVGVMAPISGWARWGPRREPGAAGYGQRYRGRRFMIALLADVATIASGIALTLSVLFVGYELRVNAKLARASNAQSLVEISSSFISQIMQDRETPGSGPWPLELSRYGRDRPIPLSDALDLVAHLSRKHPLPIS